MNMLESLASSAVRAAGKVQADLIIVYTATGKRFVGGEVFVHCARASLWFLL
jgi:hypothetical protein